MRQENPLDAARRGRESVEGEIDGWRQRWWRRTLRNGLCVGDNLLERLRRRLHKNAENVSSRALVLRVFTGLQQIETETGIERTRATVFFARSDGAALKLLRR